MTVNKKSVEEILHETELLLKTNDHESIKTYLPTDLTYLKSFSYIINNNENYEIPILWLYNLISNPFDIKKIVKENDLKIILNFLIDKINLNNKLDKTIFKTLALILNNLEDFEIKSIEIKSKISFYRILYEMTKINKKIFKLEINENENLIIQKYKIKILSYQKNIANINILLNLLNTKNSKLGWTLAKSINRITNENNCKLISTEIIKKLNSIFANESLWINSATILAFFILKGEEIYESIEIAEKMIFYDNLNVNKSEQVRETGLFLFWCLIRSQKIEGNELEISCDFNNEINYYNESVKIKNEIIKKDDNKKEFENLKCINNEIINNVDDKKDYENFKSINNETNKNDKNRKEYKNLKCINNENNVNEVDNKKEYSSKNLQCINNKIINIFDNKLIKEGDKEIIKFRNINLLKEEEENFIKNRNNNLLKNLILISLFDYSLNCRRAASTVILEFLGRNKIEKGNLITDLINFDSVKRFENILKIIPDLLENFINFKDEIFNFAEKKFFSNFVFINGDFLIKILKKRYSFLCEIKVELNENLSNTLSILFILKNIKEHENCIKCKSNNYIKHFNEITLSKFYTTKFFDQFMENYIEYIVLKNTYNDKIEENLIFLLDKNIHNEKIIKISYRIDPEILFRNLNKKNNSAYILANACNLIHRKSVLEKYIIYMKGNDQHKKMFVIKSAIDIYKNKKFEKNYLIKCINEIKNREKYNKYDHNFLDNLDNDQTLIFYIINGLEDYSVDIRGDAGFFVRKEALDFIFIYAPCIAKNYAIRFIVDKCPKLRIIAMEKLRTLTNKKNTGCNEFLCIQNFYNLFLILSEELKNKYSDEILHFYLCIGAFEKLSNDQKEEFFIGILCFFKNCNGFDFNHLKSKIFDFIYSENGKKIILNFLNAKKRFQFLTIYFLFELYKISNEKIQNEIKIVINYENIEDYGPKSKEMINYMFLN